MTSQLPANVKVGMVFSIPSSPTDHYVVIDITETTVLIEKINNRINEGEFYEKSCNRAGYGYGWFKKNEYTFIRQMGKEELSKYEIKPYPQNTNTYVTTTN